jgi:large subunit ribosomal protein L7/L12
MTEATAFAPETKDMGDRIAGLTLKEAKALSDYLEQIYGIKPAAGGAVVMPGPVDGGGGGGKPTEKTEFDVVLTGFGDAKIGVIKEVRAITGMGLKEAKDAVEGVPTKIKEGVSKEEAEDIKKKIVAAGGTVEIK